MERPTRNLLLFFIITFSWSWLFWSPQVFAVMGLITLLPGVSYLFLSLGVLGPSVGAFILTYLNESKEGVTKLFRRGLDTTIGWKTIILSFIILPLISSIVYFLTLFIEKSVPIFPDLLALIYLAPIYFFGAFAEEFGWRGYSLGRLQYKYSALVSSFILGGIWGLWHLPLKLSLGNFVIFNYLIYILTVISLAILFTFIHNNTNGNILAAVILHLMVNLSFFLFPYSDNNYIIGALIYLSLLCVIDSVIIVIWGSKKMFKKPKNVVAT